jgi:hypothetical protein
MSTQMTVLIIAVIALIALLVSRRGGPRVTQIDRTIRRDESEGRR